MDVACPGNPPFGRYRPPLVAGAGGGEVVAAQRVRCARLVSQGTRITCMREGAGSSPSLPALACRGIATTPADGSAQSWAGSAPERVPRFDKCLSLNALR